MDQKPDVDANELVEKREWVLYGCISIFTACLVISSITASKLWSLTLPVVDYEVIIPVGTSLFTLTFLATDVVGEVWGKRHSMMIVYMGLIARLMMLGFFAFAVNITPVSFYTGQQCYEAVLGGSSNIIIAGVIAYFISQTNDVFVFHYFKDRDQGKNLLWKRNNLSTFSSQFLDSFIFIVLAFYETATISQLTGMIVGQVIVKWIIAILDTPFVYMLRNIATHRKLFDFKG
jgi:uncharacterized integral membrane protein (TIGR00697 family)